MIIIPRLRTGLGNLDISLGGGIPIGSSTLIWGPEKTGKTTLVGNIMASFQRTFPEKEIVYIETEDKYDAPYFTSIGVDIETEKFTKQEDRFYISEVFDFVLEVLRNIDNYPHVGLVAIDSLGPLCALTRLEDSVDQQRIPPEAAITARAMSQISTELTRRRILHKDQLVTILLTTHQIKPISSNPRIQLPALPAGGGRLRLLTATRIQLRKPEYQKETTTHGIKRASRVELPYRVNANFQGPSNDTGSCFIFQVPSSPFNVGQPDDLDSWWEWARKVGYISGGGSSWQVGHYEEPFKGKIALFDFWREHLDLYRKDQDAILPLAVEYLKEASK